MAAIPKDPVMLMSFFNTHLRDHYRRFGGRWNEYDLDAEEMKKKLSAIDYHYDADRNQFV